MSPLRFEYEVSVPQTARGVLSLFEGKSPVWNVASVLVAGAGWALGYAVSSGGGTLRAMVIGGIACGLVLGISFTRALGGPALNLVMSFVWPPLFGSILTLVGALPVERLFGLNVGVALVFPAFFTTLACMLVWPSLLGPDRIDRWTRETHPDVFFDDT